MATNLQVPSNISATPQFIQDASGNNSKLAISSGNIGIGTTTNVSSVLHVRASDASGAYGGTIVSGTIGLIDATGSASPARLAILKGNDAEILNFGGANSTDEAGVQYDPNTHKLAFKTNSLENLVIIDGSGSVGIGTTAPSTKLTVSTHDGSCDGILLTNPSGDMRCFLGRAGSGHGFLDLYDNSSKNQIQLTTAYDLLYINYGNFGIGTTMPASRLEIAGSVALKVVTKTAPYTPADEAVIHFDASGGPFSITLPSAAGIPGRTYYIKKIDSTGNAITIQRSGSDLIDGATSKSISVQYGCYQIVSDGGSAWYIIAKK